MQGVNVPVILVGNKSDQRSLLPPDSTVQNSEVLQLMSEHREIETCIDCSAKDMVNIAELFYFAQKAVLHPARLLYDSVSRTMKPECVQALKRVFWLSDLDGDGVLSPVELNNFQVKCFDISLNEKELGDIVSAVSEALPEGVSNGCLNLNGFLQLHKLFIQQGRAETTWSVLRKYGYGHDLSLSEDIIYPEIEVDPSRCVELSADGFEFITELFRRFDRDKDASLDDIELKNLFSVLPYSSPWSEYNFPNCTLTNASGNVTLQGWLAMWSMVTLLDYNLTLEYFGYLGFPGSPSSALRLTKRRSATPKFKRKLIDKNTLSNEDLSNKKSSKYFKKDSNEKLSRLNSRLISNNFGSSLNDNVTKLKSKNSSIKKLISKHNDSKTPYTSKSAKSTSLVYVIGSPGCGKIKEFGLYTNMALGNNRALDSCDLLCMVYDSSDPHSFQYLIDLRNHYNLDNIPTLFIATKSDLDPVEQHSETPPDIYCRDLKLKSPLFISVKNGQTAGIFEKMADLSYNQ
ncbi:Mitochondrial Rho GTPase 1 [Smittium mucronatum]|uniref:Mitochondrial Rho GTPase 1 n=1 Tax=Smittium mucronatum TaxID=133383 RepID=A0A1R0H2T7_9FUNG|nr:Mitochondrial Rho GTPase 1 [Smittium mucronatum]